jgi:hypothetical protein
MTDESIEAKAQRTLSLVRRLRERNEHEAADRIEELETQYDIVTRLYVQLRREHSGQSDGLGYGGVVRSHHDGD